MHGRLKNVLWYMTAMFFFLNVISQMVFVYTRPRTAIPSLGRVYPLNVHGTIVYLTFPEHLVSGFPTFILSAVFGICFVVVSRREERDREIR
jgi:hypothetical protein